MRLTPVVIVLRLAGILYASSTGYQARQAPIHDQINHIRSSDKHFGQKSCVRYLERGYETWQRRQVRQVDGHQVEGDAGAGAKAVADDGHLGVPLHR